MQVAAAVPGVRFGYRRLARLLELNATRDYDNGHSYYPLHGSRVSLPAVPDDAPGPDYLRWHNEQVYRAS